MTEEDPPRFGSPLYEALLAWRQAAWRRYVAPDGYETQSDALMVHLVSSCRQHRKGGLR